MTSQAKTKTFEYDVIKTFWDGPHLREAGEETVWKTEDEARYYEPHILRKKADDAKASATSKPSKTKG